MAIFSTKPKINHCGKNIPAAFGYHGKISDDEWLIVYQATCQHCQKPAINFYFVRLKSGAITDRKNAKKGKVQEIEKMIAQGTLRRFDFAPVQNDGRLHFFVSEFTMKISRPVDQSPQYARD